MAPLDPALFAPPRRPPSRGLAIAMTIVTGTWIAGVLVVLHVVGWFVGEAYTELEVPVPAWLVPTVAWVPAALAVVPAILLAALSRLDFARLAGRVWIEAAVIGALLGTVRVIPTTYREVYLAVLALVALGLALIPKPTESAPRSHSTPEGVATGAPGGHSTPEVVASGGPGGHSIPEGVASGGARGHSIPEVVATGGGRGHSNPEGGASGLLGVAAGLVSLMPWLWLGALGGAVETVLAAAACLAIGWLAGRRLAPLLRVGGGLRNRWGRMAVTGLVVGVALVGVATGIGKPGINVLELLVLPALGFVAASAARPSMIALVAIAAFGPLAFVDPVETTLLLGTEDAGYWALVAALAALGLTLLVSAVAPALRPRRGLAAGAAAAVAIAAVVVYVGPGHPGLYGERVFVVMKQQADLAGLDAIADRDERLKQTYKRLVDTADASQLAIRKQLRNRGLHFQPYYLINGLEVDGGQVVRTWLAGRGDVDRVLLSPQLRPLPRAAAVLHGSNPAPDAPQWNLTSIGADQVWSQLGVTGEGITVGGSDSGVDGTHPALRANFRGGDDSWLDPFGTETTPVDYNGHGTHTMASAVGAKVGVAPGANWVGCVNLPRNLGNPAAYLTCMQFMLAPYRPGGDPLHDGDPERAPQVLTNSWGCPELEGCDHDSLRQAVAALNAAGIYFVAAAGNSGPDCGTIEDAPATYADTLVVGAINQRGQLAAFSSRGPTPDGLAKPDIVAPGARVLSALPGGTYGYLDGTSMATPHVAGVVALMYSANPRLIGNIPKTTEILRSTATPINGEDACGGPQDTVGAGKVNALAAVQAALAVR